MAPPVPFPIDYDAITRVILAALRDATGFDQNKTILLEPEEPNWPRPAAPYFTLKITDAAIRYGGDSLMPAARDATVRYYSGQRALNGSFNCYGKSHQEALSYMALWQAALATPRTRGILKGAGLAVWRPGSVADLSALLNTGWEGRAHLDCLFGVASNLATTLDYIEGAALQQADTAD